MSFTRIAIYACRSDCISIFCRAFTTIFRNCRSMGLNITISLGAASKEMAIAKHRSEHTPSLPVKLVTPIFFPKTRQFSFEITGLSIALTTPYGSLRAPCGESRGVLETAQAFSDSRPWYRLSPALATSFRMSPGLFQTFTGDPL